MHTTSLIPLIYSSNQFRLIYLKSRTHFQSRTKQDTGLFLDKNTHAHLTPFFTWLSRTSGSHLAMCVCMLAPSGEYRRSGCQPTPQQTVAITPWHGDKGALSILSSSLPSTFSYPIQLYSSLPFSSQDIFTQLIIQLLT